MFFSSHAGQPEILLSYEIRPHGASASGQHDCCYNECSYHSYEFIFLIIFILFLIQDNMYVGILHLIACVLT